MATMISTIPVTVSGFGTREAALIALMAPFGASPAPVIALSLSYFVLSDMAPSMVGAALAVKERV